MLVAAWFLIVTLVILFGFGFVIATFIHWFQVSRAKKMADVVSTDSKASVAAPPAP